jgi:drug/metabolite transporter (DMT)-like permease
MLSLRKNGVFLMLVANVFFALIPITVRLADRLGYSSTQTTFFRFAFATVGVFGLAAMGWQRFQTINFKAVFWRGLFGGSSVMFYFLALHWTSAAKGTLLNYTYTIWANVYAVVFLRQKLVKGFGILLLLALVGVWLVLGVGFSPLNRGDVAGILSGAIAGAATVAIKEARRTDNALTVFGSFSFFGLVISALFLWVGPSLGGWAVSLCQWTPLDERGWLVLLGMGAVSMLAQLLFTQGYGHTSLHTGTLLSLLVPVLASILGVFILHEPVAPHFVLGTVLVLTACGLFGWKSKNTSNNPHSPPRHQDTKH